MYPFTTTLSVLILIFVATGSSPDARAQGGRDYVYIVGSSTVYPFSTIVAERFGRSTQYRTPKVESTGSGGGFKLFCDGVGVDYPDISNASRRINAEELENCQENGVSEIVEIKIGYDGIVFANALNAPEVSLTHKDIFLALAKEVPAGTEGTLVSNPNRYWSDIRPGLPRIRIEVLGPPTSSGTREEFAKLAMEDGCRQFPWIRRLEMQDAVRFRRICRNLREDGAYVEATENDNLIVHKLQANPRAFGIFGFSFLDQNSDKVKAAAIENIKPDFDAIVSHRYPNSRPLYFYVKKDHVAMIPGLRDFLAELTSERALGDEGYLVDRGLIPMPEDERLDEARSVASLETLTLAGN